MDIRVEGLRDRRSAAADVFKTRDGRHIYAETPARRLGDRSSRADARTAPFDRSPADIRAVILHCTGFTSGEALPVVAADGDIRNQHRLDFVIAHFVVRGSGDILYAHDVQYRLNSVSGRRGIDIEFEGEFRHDRVPRAPRLTVSAIFAGRRLLSALKSQIPAVRYVHPHGQVQTTGGNPKRDSCPGPDVWVNVGEWAVRNLGFICDTSVMPNNHGISPAQHNPAYDQHV